MAREAIERELQHDLRRPGRPSPLPLHVLKALEEATDVEQQAGEFRPNRIERVAHALPRGDDSFRE
jgi:hypothetical protein